MKKSVYILALGAFGIITTEFGVIGILPLLAKEFKVSIDTAGWLISAFALTVAVSGPIAIKLTSKINRKMLLCAVLAVFILSNLISAIAPNFTVLIIARILPAFLHPIFWAVSVTVAAKQVAAKDAPKAIAVVMSGLSIATVLGVPLTTYVSDLLNWQASFLIAALINLVAFIAMLAFIPSMPVEKQVSVKTKDDILKDPILWLRFATSTIIVAGMFATYGYLAEFLSKISRMSGSEISIMLLVFGGMGIIGNWLMGIALSKNVALTTRFYLLAILIIHLLAYQFGGGFLPMAIIVSIWGFVHTGGFLLNTIFMMDSVAPQSQETVNSFMPSIFNAGIALGTFLGGLVITNYGIHNIIWLSILLFLLGLIGVFSAHRKAIKTIENDLVSIPQQQIEEVVGLD